jgi:UDP-N-acetylmuramoyl-tripeptide--D-alanyl-D-alanine ligase
MILRFSERNKKMMQKRQASLSSPGDNPCKLWLRRTALWLRQDIFGYLLNAVSPLIYWIAFFWRRMLVRTTFIAVTGSLGKTTAKELIAAVLSSQAPTTRSFRNQNSGVLLALNVLRVRPWTRFAVIELAGSRPGIMRPAACLLRPDAAVILPVLRTHTGAFQTLDEHARENEVLLSYVKRDGFAVLNGDDPRVLAMAQKAPCSVVTVGTSPNFDLWASNVASTWPDRLGFDVSDRTGKRLRVSTCLVGKHWLPSVLAVLSTAQGFGIELTVAAEKLAMAQPYPGRLQPVALPSGAVLLRDDYNASIDTVEAGLKVLEEATAARRWLVMTDLTDLGRQRHRPYRLRFLADRASKAADAVVFIGESAEYGRRRAVCAGIPPGMAHGFRTLLEASTFLASALGPGDLVLLKGRTTDHAARLYFALLGPVKCWKDRCTKRMLCDICWKLGV